VFSNNIGYNRGTVNMNCKIRGLRGLLLLASDEGAKLEKGEINHTQYMKNIDTIVSLSYLLEVEDTQIKEHTLFVMPSIENIDMFRAQIRRAVEKALEQNTKLCRQNRGSFLYPQNFRIRNENIIIDCCQDIWNKFHDMMKNARLKQEEK
jgi:hypothetical protein